ncbi:MAG: NAD(P)H-dependent glycerol-3-phosphate dehydrogenase [Candidatus Margulisiibacteriota bacterium]
MKISVIGAGAWGTTIANLLAEKGFDTVIWALEEKTVFNINGARENNHYLPGIRLSNRLKAVKDMGESAKDAEIVVVAIPSKFLRSSLETAGDSIEKRSIILGLTKGIEKGTFKRPSQIISEITGNNTVAALSGPNLSMEIAKGLPAASVAASKDAAAAKKIQEVLSGDKFRVYTSDDIIGVEIGGAMKNIIALAAGICDGLNLGNNAKSALIVRGLAEIIRLGTALGAKAETFSGLSGIGDLITTCESSLSRNHTVGREIAKGKKIRDILNNMSAIPEGVETTSSAYDLAKKIGVELPITNEIYSVLFDGKDPKAAISVLMARVPKSEMY